MDAGSEEYRAFMGGSIVKDALLPSFIAEQAPDGELWRPALLIALCTIARLAQEAAEGAWRGRGRAAAMTMIPDSHRADAIRIIEGAQTERAVRRVEGGVISNPSEGDALTLPALIGLCDRHDPLYHG